MFESLPNVSTLCNPAYVAEFFGSLLLILFGCGSCANATLPKTKGNNGGYFMVVTGWSFGVALIVFLFARASGAHVNPAITVALAMAGLFPWVHVCPYIIAQFLGCFAGAILVYLVYAPYFKESTNPDANLTIFCTAPGVRSKFWSFMAEMIATAILLFIITGLGYAAKNGDAIAQRVYRICAEKLGLGLSILIDVLNPEAIVIGSIYSRDQALFDEIIRDVIAKEALPLSASVCKILPAGLGNAIGDYAALSLAFQ